MNSKMIEIATRVLNVEASIAKKNCKKISNYNLYYFWNPIRGGGSVIINEVGEKLAATSGVSFENHLQSFLNGKRN